MPNDNQKFELDFSGDTKKAILELISQYHLDFEANISLQEALQRENPRVVIFNLAKRILNREGKFQDISEILKKELNMRKEDADKLAMEIKDKIVSMAKPEISEETPKILDEKEIVQEAILEKIKSKVTEDAAKPETVVKLKIASEEKITSIIAKEADAMNVEGNAKKLAEERGKQVGSLKDQYRERTE